MVRRNSIQCHIASFSASSEKFMGEHGLWELTLRPLSQLLHPCYWNHASCGGIPCAGRIASRPKAATRMILLEAADHRYSKSSAAGRRDGIGDYFQEVLVAGNAANVLRRTAPVAAETNGRFHQLACRDDLLQNNLDCCFTRRLRRTRRDAPMWPAQSARRTTVPQSSA